MQKITITAPAHLHAGNFDLTGDLGRLYGTVGFAVDLPLEVEVSKAKGVIAEDKSAFKFAKRFVDKFGLDGAEIKIKKEIPRFVGVGFHTTLALSIGVALSKLYDLRLSVEDVSLLMGRGTITAMGVYAFKTGGFIVEGGFKISSRTKMVPPLIFHGAVPETWFFIIAIPNESRQKIAEMRENEDEILGNLKIMPKKLSDELSRLVLVKLMPAFVEKDLKSFGEALTSFNQRLGKFWRDYQEGTYCNQVVEEGIRIMLRHGSLACQSSWGPTFYSIIKGKRSTDKLANELTKFLEKSGGGEIYVTHASNHGAIVKA